MTGTAGKPIGAASVPTTPVRPVIRQLRIERFRGIKDLTWRPSPGINVVLGGGDAGKTTILDAVALLLSPTNPTTLSDADYNDRKIADGFSIEAVMALSEGNAIDYTFKPAWPWEWNGEDAVVPSADSEVPAGSAVYRVRVRGTPDLDLVYEIVQPDSSADSFSVTLRRAIGLVRLGGDDRNDRDLRLVQGSALDRLLSDKTLRSRIAASLGDITIKAKLEPDKGVALATLDDAFAKENLPQGLDLSIIGGQGASIASMVGLTAAHNGAQLPLASWGSGTRRLAALAIAEQNQTQAPITIVDEVERGLEPYRQRRLIEKLQKHPSQAFATTHSPFVIAAASQASFWYVDHAGTIGPLDGKKIARARKEQPAVFLSRLSIIAEGATEVGFVSALLERALGSGLDTHGIHVCDGGANETALDLLQALTKGGLRFGGFADNEGKHQTAWQNLIAARGALVFQWAIGCLETNLISALKEDQFEAFIEDPDGGKTGRRRRTLADRLGSQEKELHVVLEKAGAGFRNLMAEAATGVVPEDKKENKSQKKEFESHGQDWFKTLVGGRELEAKLFSLGLWPSFKDRLLPFCNAARTAVGLPEILDLS